jgi:hypothetical protein
VKAVRLIASGAVLSACVVAWAVEGDQTLAVAPHLLRYGVAFAAYLVALQASAGGLPRRVLALTLGLAAAWRLALVAAPPLLSDDVNRYVWEGRIQLHGGNPYAWGDRPEAPKWAALRDEAWRGVSHKDYTAIYPPVAQASAAAVVAVHDSVSAMKAFAAACEALTALALAFSLRRRGLPASRLLVLAWSPLALVEIAGSGHNDALGMLFAALGLLALDAGRPALSAAAMALGFQAKLLPGLVAAAWARRYRPAHAAIGLLLAALVVVPYAGAGAGLVRSLGKYGEFWRFNETLFAAAAALMPTRLSAIGLTLAAMAVVAAVLAWRRVEPAAAALAVVVAWIVLAPNLLPWYALWLLPWLVLRDHAPALLFTGTVGLAYLVYPEWHSGQPWRLGWGIRALEYGPCLALVVAQAVRRRAAFGRSAGAPELRVRPR